MSLGIHSSGGILRDTVWPSGGDLWATVRNLEEKIHSRPNEDRPLSVRPPRDSPRMIAQRSSGVYRRKLIGRWLADVPLVPGEATARQSLDHRMMYCRRPKGDLPITTGTPLNSIKAEFWRKSSQKPSMNNSYLLLTFADMRWRLDVLRLYSWVHLELHNLFCVTDEHFLPSRLLSFKWSVFCHRWTLLTFSIPE